MGFPRLIPNVCKECIYKISTKEKSEVVYICTKHDADCKTAATHRCVYNAQVIKQVDRLKECTQQNIEFNNRFTNKDVHTSSFVCNYVHVQ